MTTKPLEMVRSAPVLAVTYRPLLLRELHRELASRWRSDEQEHVPNDRRSIPLRDERGAFERVAAQAGFDRPLRRSLSHNASASTVGLVSGFVNHFDGAARVDARYRPGYPWAVWDLLLREAPLDAFSSVLDLGCGPGSVALSLVGFVLYVIGVDPDPGMLVEATRAAKAAGS